MLSSPYSIRCYLYTRTSMCRYSDHLSHTQYLKLPKKTWRSIQQTEAICPSNFEQLMKSPETLVS